MKIVSVKIILTRLLFLSVLLSGTTLVNANENADLFVASGYPYKNLVERFDQVKIHYSELNSEGVVMCRVELVSNTQSRMTESIKAKDKHFAEKPLKSCIDRNEAIAALQRNHSG